MNEPAQQVRRHSSRWWKIGFVLALLAFEVTRELLVLQWNAPPNLAIGVPSAYRSTDGSYVSAEGRWERTDGGERLLPDMVSIQCEREIGSCIIADTQVTDGYVGIPSIMRRAATFTDTGAEFMDDWPTCSQLFVRVDGVHKMTTAVRSAKPSNDQNCKNFEKQIQMRLGGFQKEEFEESRKGHFTPLMSALGWVLGLL